MKRNKNGTWELTDQDMNLVSMWAEEAAISRLHDGDKILGDAWRAQSHKIYETLKAARYYDDTKWGAAE